MFGHNNGSGNGGNEVAQQRGSGSGEPSIPPLRTFRVRYWDDQLHEMLIHAHVVQITASGALVFAVGYWNTFTGAIAEHYPQVFNRGEWARYEEVIVPEASGIII